MKTNDTETKTCKNCEHWGESYLNGYGNCTRIEDYEGGVAFVDGEPGVASILKTLPDFGCTEFKAKSIEGLCPTCHKNPSTDDHPCPFESDVHNDPTKMCNCCSACETECARAI
jgi:hypothetical protein